MQSHNTINLALVSDFSYPFLGGVQIHIIKLAQQLKSKLNKYQDHVGEKCVNGIKFYYLKLPYHKDLNITYATYCFNYFIIKKIFKKEQINLVHVHQSSSCLSLQTTLYSGVMGLKVIHTEHSLFGFKSMFDIHINKFLQIISVLYSQVICVSRTTRNNFILRSDVSCEKVVVIPNAADIKIKLKPYKNYDNKKPLNIVFVGRLTYRRGVDLLIDILEDFLQRFSYCRFKIIGDGVKFPILKRFIEDRNLIQYVELLGSIQNQKVIEAMQDCHIYINTPLTQSFGIALIEAASEGLLCVSTEVGGVHQTLPKQLLITVQPTKNSFILGLMEAIERVKSRKHLEHEQDMRRIQTYNWCNVGQRVLQVYQRVHNDQKAISRKQVVNKTLIKKNIIGYFMLIWFLVLCFINDFHDKLKSNDKRSSNKTL